METRGERKSLKSQLTGKITTQQAKTIKVNKVRCILPKNSSVSLSSWIFYLNFRTNTFIFTAMLRIMQYETIKLSCELGLPVVDQESKQADCFFVIWLCRCLRPTRMYLCCTLTSCCNRKITMNQLAWSFLKQGWSRVDLRPFRLLLQNGHFSYYQWSFVWFSTFMNGLKWDGIWALHSLLWK